jgi:hypothetical protein
MAGCIESKQTEHEKSTRRTRKITFRLSEAEYASIASELAVCSLSFSALTRKRLLGEHIASKADLAVLAELRRLGGLLKHIHNETRGTYSDLTAQAIKNLSVYVRALAQKGRAAYTNQENDAP